MHRLLAGPIGSAALVATLTLAASTALIVGHADVRSPFSSDLNAVEFFLIGGPFFLLILGPFGWANGVTPRLRTLRTLPVSAMTIVVTMTMLSLLIPVFFWILATGVYLVVGVTGDSSWRLESFALLCGVMALSGAVHARFNSIVAVMGGWGAAVIGAILMLELFDTVAMESVIAFGFPVVGIVGVLAASLLNYRTVTRGSSSSPIYRPAPGESLYRGHP